MLGPARRPPRKGLRHPAIGLPATVLFGLLAAFFGWQAAAPLWLAVGVGADGTAIPTRCDATGGTVATDQSQPAVTYPCITFEADDGSFRAVDVTLLGTGPDPAGPDPARPDHVPARMVSPDEPRAYATGLAGLHLRWTVGLTLVLACGAGVAWATGAFRLERAWSRRRAVLLTFAGPLLLTAGFLAAAL